MTEEIEEKQLYLRKEILDQGYDAEEFIDYLNNELKITAELNLIGFQELKDVVQGFRNKKNGELLKNKEAEIRQSSKIDKPLI